MGKIHLSFIAAVLIAYIVGAKYPGLAKKVGIA